MSPRDRFERGLRETGLRHQRFIRYDDECLYLTMPSTPKGTAKVLSGRGIKVHGLLYWSDALRSVENSSVEVRYDPDDWGTVYARVGATWQQCHSEHYSVFASRSAGEIRIASAELRARQRTSTANGYVTASALANFLAGTSQSEAVLKQRRRDAASRDLTLMSGRELRGIQPPDEREIPVEVASAEVARIEPETIEALKGFDIKGGYDGD